jgi:hypothetical protein
MSAIAPQALNFYILKKYTRMTVTAQALDFYILKKFNNGSYYLITQALNIDILKQIKQQ